MKKECQYPFRASWSLMLLIITLVFSHSTGRGGLANLTGVHSPPPELSEHQAQAFETSGRGGAGNIRSRSQSRDSPRSGSRDRISRIWHKVAHPHGRGIEEESSNAIVVDGDGPHNHE